MLKTLLIVIAAAQAESVEPRRDALLDEERGKQSPLVCKWVPRENSRMKKRECRPEREWDVIRAQSQEFMSRRINF